MSQKAWVEAENARMILSVPLMSTVSPIQVARCTVTPPKDCDEAEKAGESTLVPPMSSMVLAHVAGCLVMPQKAWVEAKKA